MTITELIRSLEDIMRAHGDLDVRLADWNEDYEKPAVVQIVRVDGGVILDVYD